MASLTNLTPGIGDSGDNALQGDDLSNVLHGEAGDDTLTGLGGADTLIGGAGADLLFGGSGANVLYGGDGNDFLTYDSADANGELQRLFGEDGSDTLVLEFTLSDYLQPGVIAEVQSYFNALQAGQDPGAGAEFIFTSFNLRAQGFESLLVFVDGEPIQPGENPGVAAADDTFTVNANTVLTGDVTGNDNVPSGTVLTLLTGPAQGTLSLGPTGGFSFTPGATFVSLGAGQTTDVTFTYRLSEGGLTSDATARITVAGVNDAPTAGAINVQTDENLATSGNLLSDSGAADVDQLDVLRIESVGGVALNGAARAITLPSGAVITVDPNGAYTYAPGAAFDSLAAGDTGQDNIAFVVADGNGGAATSTLTVNLTGQNDAPTATPDLFVISEDAGRIVDPLANDFDVDQGDSVLFVSIDDPQDGGTLTLLQDGTVFFDPQGDFEELGVGEFTDITLNYVVQDQSGTQSAGVSTFRIMGVNDDPTGNDPFITTSEDAPQTGNLLNFSEADDVDLNDVLRIASVDGTPITGPFTGLTSGGAVLTVMANGDFTLDPRGAFDNLADGDQAEDSFSFVISDGKGGELPLTARITILGENDAPVANDVTVQVSEDGGLSDDLLSLSNAFDPDDGGSVFLGSIDGVSAGPSPTTINDAQGALLTFDDSGAITFDPMGSYEFLSVGDVAFSDFSFAVIDDFGAETIQSISFEIQGENDDPTGDDVSISTDEDTSVTGNLLAESNAFDVDQNDSLTISDIFVDVQQNTSLGGVTTTFTLPTGALLTVAPNGDYTYDPSGVFEDLAAGDFGSDGFVFRVVDGQGGQVNLSANIDVAGVNDAPTADPITRGALEDDTVSGDLLAASNAFDIDNGDVLSVVSAAGALVDLSGTIVQADNGGSLFLSANGQYTFNPRDNNGVSEFDFLSVGDTAETTVAFTIADQAGEQVDTQITFVIAGANDDPTLDQTTLQTDEDTDLTGDLLVESNAQDIDQNDTLSVTRVSGGGIVNADLNGSETTFTLNSGAVLTVAPDGTYSYVVGDAFQTLADGQSDQDSLSLTISDDQGATASASLSFSIAGVNDAPVVDPIQAFTTEDEPTGGNLLTDSNAFDVDTGDAISVTAVDGQALNGTTTITHINGGQLVVTGSDYQFSPNGAFEQLSVGDTADRSFEFTVSDQFGDDTVSTITVTVTGVNDDPTASEFGADTDEDTVLTGNFIVDSSAADIDQNDDLQVTAISGSGDSATLNGADATLVLTSGVVLTVSPNGTFSFDPRGQFDFLDVGQSQSEIVDFTISDGNGGFVQQSATINILGVNDDPVAVDDTATTDQNTFVLVNLTNNDSDVDNAFQVTGFTQSLDGGRVDVNPQSPPGAPIQDVIFDPNGDFDFIALNDQFITSFTYTITDTRGGTDTATVTVTIDGLNDGPITTPLNATTNEDVANFTFDLLQSQFDPDDGAILSVENFAEVGSSQTAFSVVNSTYQLDARQFDALNATETATLTYSYDVVDEFGARTSNTFSVVVEGRDEGLQAVDDNFITDEDSPLSDDVSLNDTFGAGVFSVVQDVSRGLLTLNGDGTFDFDPNGDFDDLAQSDLDSETFTYAIDNGVQRVEATVNIDIIGVNDAAFIDDVDAVTDEDTFLSLNILDDGAAFDLDGLGAIELDSFDGNLLPSNGSDLFLSSAFGGTITVNRSGAFTFDPVGTYDFLSEGDSEFEGYSIEIIDDFGDKTTASLFLEITGVNDAPEGQDAFITADEDNGAAGNLLDDSLAFDIDQFDELFISEVEGQTVFGGVNVPLGSGADLFIDEFGDYSYETNGVFDTLAVDEFDFDSFSFSISDGFVDISLFADIEIEGLNDVVVVDDAQSSFDATFIGSPAASGALPATIDASMLDGANGFALVSVGGNEGAGSVVGGGGDFNGDGFTDLLVGIPGYSAFYVNGSGATFVLYGTGANQPAGRTIPAVTPVTDGVTLIGASLERLSDEATFIGDVDGDGIDDVLIANGFSASQQGVVRLVSGSNLTSFNGQQYIDGGQSTLIFDSSTSDPTQSLGSSVASAGDVNGDGINDFIIGAPYFASSPGPQNGKAFVVFGQASAFGAQLDLASLDGTNGFQINDGGIGGAELGSSVGGIGDVNGDGFDDIGVGSQGYSISIPLGQGEYATASPGQAYVIFGNNTGFSATLDVSTASAVEVATLSGGLTDDQIGTEIEGIGDFNGDGIDDFILGASYYYSGQDPVGKAFIIFGDGSGGFGDLDLERLTPNDGFQIIGAYAYDMVGDGIAGAGDFNGDGLNDVVIGAQRNFEGIFTGSAYVLFGFDGAPTSRFDLAGFTADDGVLITGVNNGDRFGADVAGIGDFNGDGADDIIIGAPDAGSNGAGGAFVVYGATARDPAIVSGSIFFDDIDLSDTHFVSTGTPVSADVTFLAGLATDSTGGVTGELIWTAEIDLAAYDAIAAGATVIETITVTIDDGFGGAASRDVTVTFEGVNDAPTADAALRTTDEDTAFTDGDLIAESNAADVDVGDTLRVSSITFDIDSSSNTVALSATPTVINLRGGLLTIDETGAYSFDPNDAFEFLGTGDQSFVTFEFTIEDSLGDTAVNDAVIQIQGVNDTPTAVDDTALTNQDTALSISVFDNDFDPEGALQVISVDTTGTIGSVGIESGDQGQIVYNPNGQFDGLDDGEFATDTFTYTVVDVEGLQATATVAVTVSGLNDAPVALPVNAMTTEDDTVSGNFIIDGGSFDPDTMDTLTVEAVDGQAVTGAGQFVTLNSGATLNISPDGSFTYIPIGIFDTLADGEQTSDTITVTLGDGDVTADADLIVAITGVNDAPTATPLTAVTNEDETLFSVNLLKNVTDPDNQDVLTVENLVEVGANLGNFMLEGTTLSYDPTVFDGLMAGETATANFTFDVVDLAGERVSTTLAITIEGRDETLVATDDMFTTDEDTPISGDVSVNDQPQGGVYSVLIGPNGDLTLNADGTFDYDPTTFYDNLTGSDLFTDSFTYQIANGVDTVTGSVLIDVVGINDAPAPIGPQLTNIRLVTEDDSGASSGNGQSLAPALSGDGQTVVYDSNANNLLPDGADTNARTDVYFEDPQQANNRASVQNGTNNQITTNGASNAEVSADGAVIVFQSLASDLVPTDANGNPIPDNNRFDIYVRDVFAGETQLLIQNGVDGQRLNGNSLNPSVSADGRFTTFQSTATNIVSDTDDNGAGDDIYLHDRQAGQTILISQISDTVELSNSFAPTISADGSTVVFLTANSFDPSDTNGLVDVYAYDVATAALSLVSRDSIGIVGDQAAISFTGGQAVSTPSVSGNGRYVSWVSRATNLVDNDTNNADDIFVHDRLTGATERVSVSTSGQEANSFSFDAKLSDNGRFVTYQSRATNLDELLADTNNDNDIYVYDRVTGDNIRVSVTPAFDSQPGGGQSDISADGGTIAFASGTVTGNFDPRVVTGNVNDIYVATVDVSGFTITEDATQGFVDLESEWFDPDGGQLVFSNINVSSADTDRIVTFTDHFDDNGNVIGLDIVPAEFNDLGANDYEILTVTYDVTDGFVSVAGTTGIVIEGVNDAPVGVDETFQVNQGATITGFLSASDVDSSLLTFSALPSAIAGDLTVNSDGSFIYTTSPAQTVDDVVTIQVADEDGATATFTATFDVDLPPVFLGVADVQIALTADINPDPQNAIDTSAFFNDPEGGQLTFSALTSGFTNLRNSLSIDAVSGVITGTPTSSDLVRIEVTATDDRGQSTVGEFWLGTVAEVVVGDSDDNNIIDTTSTSFVDGLGGNDSITGENNFDIYQYRRGDGFDIIDDNQSGGNNRLVMTGFDSDEVQFSRFSANPFSDNGTDLLITPVGQPIDFTEGVLVRGALIPGAGPGEVAFYHFDDGVILDEVFAMNQILERESTDGDDDIRGFAADNTLAGGLGDDVLIGGDASDFYIYNAGDGDDTIRDNGNRDTDIIQIGYNFTDAAYSRVPGTDTVVADFGSGNRLTIIDSVLSSATGGIEIFRFLDGDFTTDDIRADLINQQTSEGDDAVQAFGAGVADTLDGGAGDDTLLGLDGGDTYQYRAGGGDDVVRENGFQDNDVIQIFDFTIDYDLVNGRVNAGSQVTFQRDESEGDLVFQGDSLVINLDNGAGLTGSVTAIGGIATGNNTPLSSFIFDASGVTLTGEQIRSDLLRQSETSGDDIVVGFNSADTLIGGQGNDLLLGRDGLDIYQFATGDGNDTVNEGGFQEADRVVFTDRNLSDFDIRYAPEDDNTIIFTAGADSVEVYQGLEGGVNQAISFFDFADQTLTTLEMRQVLVDQALALGLELIGGDGVQALPSSVGSDRYVEGRDGSDTYLYVAGDGNDTVSEGNTGDTDVIDLTAFSSQDFTLAGAGSIRFDPTFTDRVQLFVDANNALDIINMSRFEEIRFSDQTFDNDADAADGQDNFTDFIAAQVAAAVTADPNEDFVTKVIITDPGGNNTFTSTAANEAFSLDNSGDDQLIFNVSAIGDDSVFKTSGTTSGYDITIDFSGIVADNVLQETVKFTTSRLDQNDLIIDIIYQDTADQFPQQGIGSVQEQIVLNNALAQFGGVDTVTIVDTEGVTSGFTVTELRQLIIDQAVTSGDDAIPNYIDGGLVLRGLGGDDTLTGARGGQRFEFSPGDGRVTFAEGGNSGGGTDVLAVNGFSLTDAAISRSPSDSSVLIFDFGGGDVLTLRNFYPGGFVIEQFIFQADATTPEIVTGDEISTEYLSQLATSGNDIITGGNGRDDTLDGGLGDDTLDGADGSDTYIVRKGEGDKFIEETGSGDTDTLQLDVASTSVTFEQNPIDTSNFVIVMDDGTRVEIFNFLETTDGKIEQFVFTDTTLDTTQARLRAFDDITTNGDDTIVGGGAADTLRGGLGDDALRGGGNTDVFTYTIGDGDDTLFSDDAQNEFELIQITGVDVSDIVFTRVPGTRDQRNNSPSLDEDLLISFANNAGSIRVENGLRESGATGRVEIVDSGVTLTDTDIVNGALATDIANGRSILEGPSSGSAFFPSGASFIFAQRDGDVFSFAAGQGTLTILDEVPDDGVQRLEINGYSSSDATFTRLASGSEDFIIRLPSGDQIVVIGDTNVDGALNGVNEVFFSGDAVTLDDSEITTLLDGTIGVGPGAPVTGGTMLTSGGGVSASGGVTAGGGVTSSSGSGASPRIAGAVSDDEAPDPFATTDGDDLLVLTAADEVISLGAGDDRVELGAGDDKALGGQGDDTILGNGGADTLRGGAGQDDLRGGAGRDKLVGGGGADDLMGQGGRDTLKGGGGADDLNGGGGGDRIKGGAGRDVIEGGRGADVLSGQGGNDTFVFERGFGVDRIRDFDASAETLDFSGHNAVGQLDDLAISQVGANTILSDGLGGRIVLIGVDADQIDEGDFLF